MRIVAGKFRGRTIASPAHQGLRPTSDRVRESVFNVLSHGIDDFTIAGARIIDLFAGTGALGLEALSRGAAYCLFVEESADARALIRRNVESLGLTGETRIFRRNASNLGPAGKFDRYRLAFLDPPYGQGLGVLALRSLSEGGWLDGGALVVLEERTGAFPSIPEKFYLLNKRSWGDTTVNFLKYQP